MAGSLILVGLVYGTQLFHAEPAIGTAAVYTVEYVETKCTAGFGHVLARAFLCNWLVCLACYQATAAQDVFGKLAAIFFPVMAFVAVGFDHVVANMFIIPFGVMLGAPVTVGHYIVYSLIPTIIGNMTSSIVMISFTYSMCYGTLPARIQKRVPLFAKVFGGVSQGASSDSMTRHTTGSEPCCTAQPAEQWRPCRTNPIFAILWSLCPSQQFIINSLLQTHTCV